MLTLIVEAVDSVDGRALMVAAQQEEVLRIFDLVGQQEADRLQGLLSCKFRSKLLPGVYISVSLTTAIYYHSFSEHLNRRQATATTVTTLETYVQ